MTVENDVAVKAAALKVRHVRRDDDADIVQWRKAVEQFWRGGDIMLLLTGGDVAMQVVVEAHGTLLLHFLLVFAAAACLLRRLRGEEPYAIGRHGLGHLPK